MIDPDVEIDPRDDLAFADARTRTPAPWISASLTLVRRPPHRRLNTAGAEGPPSGVDFVGAGGIVHTPVVPARIPLFDFDGTLVDSDVALTAPFHALGVEPQRIPPLGLPLAEACDWAGISVTAYLAHYDPSAAAPFDGVADLVAQLERWGLASNKDRSSGRQELRRLGWAPEVALFSDDFDSAGKRLGPVLSALALEPDSAVYVGDTDHDRACAADVGVPFALAGWNARARAGAQPGDIVLTRPAQVLDLL